MKVSRLAVLFLLLGLVFGSAIPVSSQAKGVDSISADNMKFHLRFLGAREFEGRNTPSVGLNIASKYLALMAETYGLKPLLPGGSFYQELPLEVSTPAPARSYVRLSSETGDQKFFFPEAFGVNMRTANPGTVSGAIVFLGYGLNAPDLNWDDYGNVNLKGKVTVILDSELPAGHVLKPGENSSLLYSRTRAAREKGALGVISVISPQREKNLSAQGLNFDQAEGIKFLDLDLDQPFTSAPATAPTPFFQIEVRHDAAAMILGLSRTELDTMFETINKGRPVSRREVSGKSLEISLAFDKRKDRTLNVVGWLEGSDPQLKNEYVVIGSHHDHLAPRKGKIFPGADDNASGAVAMLEIARVLKAERPKRSIIFVWHTAEEKGLVGAYYFVAHCPVPVEKISANLNLDMITRNDPNGIYLIGSNKLSTELDESIRAMNDRSVRLKLDYKYEDPGHSDRFFFRSDQFPYVRYGVPGVWFFCGTTADYHQETDVVERADFKKMEKVTKLVYLVAMDIGNRPRLLKLDVNPAITSRGKQNMKINWRQALEKKSVAIQNVRVFDGLKVHEKATVVFRDGKIIDIGTAVDVPSDAEKIDGNGKTLLPGLIDSHVHMFPGGLEKSLIFGVTTNIDMFTDVKFMREIKKEQAAGGAANKAEMISPGTLVTAPGGHGTQFGLAIPTIRSAKEAQDFVDARIAEGSDFIKIIYDQIMPNMPVIDKETLAAVIAAAHKRDKLAVVHITTYQRALEAVVAGADSLVHVFADKLPQDGIASLVANHRFFLIPTLTVIRSLCRIPQDESFLKNPALEPYLGPNDLSLLKQTFPGVSTPPYIYAIAEEAVRKLKEANIPVLAGTDSGNPGTIYGASLHQELELLVKTGLTPLESLIAATSTPASLFNLKDRGRIAAGLRADLVLVKGNPIQEIKATRSIEAIWKKGIKVDRASYRKEIEKQKTGGQPSAPPPANLGDGFISDFEDGNSSARFGAGWVVSTDTYAGGKSNAEMHVVNNGANSTRNSLSVTGEVAPGLPYAWSGVIFFPGALPFSPADLSSKKEIVFWVKGNEKTCRVLVYTQASGYMPAGAQTFKVGNGWKQYIFKFSDFNGMDGRSLTGITFVAGPEPGPFAFQIDEIALR
jgi:imidazolonepropionase-like amidohydrolase/Zn-dependent M28 family amino/carboxypeptidase